MPAKATKPLLLVRHGKAEDLHPDGDGARGLTVTGRAEFREHARRLARLVTLEGIATSPLVRAVQTAEILAEVAGTERVVVIGELAAEAADARAIEKVARRLGPGWALVGHNPSLSDAAEHLAQLSQEVRFRKGAAFAFEIADGGTLPWSLLWSWAPGRKLEPGDGDGD